MLLMIIQITNNNRLIPTINGNVVHKAIANNYVVISDLSPFKGQFNATTRCDMITHCAVTCGVTHRYFGLTTLAVSTERAPKGKKTRGNISFPSINSGGRQQALLPGQQGRGSRENNASLGRRLYGGRLHCRNFTKPTLQSYYE